MKTITGGVEEAFDSHSEKLQCSINKTKEGEGTLEGTQVVESPTSGALTFQT